MKCKTIWAVENLSVVLQVFWTKLKGKNSERNALNFKNMKEEFINSTKKSMRNRIWTIKWIKFCKIFRAKTRFKTTTGIMQSQAKTSQNNHICKKLELQRQHIKQVVTLGSITPITPKPQLKWIKVFIVTRESQLHQMSSNLTLNSSVVYHLPEGHKSM